MTGSSAVRTAYNCSTVKINWKVFEQFCEAVKSAVDALNWMGLLIYNRLYNDLEAVTFNKSGFTTHNSTYIKFSSVHVRSQT